MYKYLAIGIVFLLGLYFISQSQKIETFTTEAAAPKIAENCPDVLIQKGSSIFLYNSKRAGVAGVNPIRFENLDEYTEFVEWQHSQGILCPILFLQHAYNAQGDAVYKARPSPTNLQGGLPDVYITPETLNSKRLPPAPDTTFQIQGTGAALGNPDEKAMAAHKNALYPGYDAHDQTIGLETPLDKMFNAAKDQISPNPMDPNWGGVAYTQQLIDAGYYKENEVSKSSCQP